ncbi:Dihydroorotate dehydrogenase (NAD(+)), catalytic subunit [hydrothermal vent metagenome]|uniref:Dihydroorotate dehydrogenase (NAD(+)), catalytic subunit n=1 Tax=hydrothermal vent metagenome TaxID=652676 RepID=A0A3B1DSF6_9ZZZZ
MNLSVKIGKVKFNNPVTVASGTFSYIEKYFSAAKVKQLGAIVPKTVTMHAQEGNPPPRIVETPSGMINAIGIENPGIDVFMDIKLVDLGKLGVPLIVSISGKTDKEFEVMTQKLDANRNVSAIELNLSCPNLQHKILVAQDAKAIRRVVRIAKKMTKKTVIAKLSPNVTDISLMAKAAEEAGADGVSMVNTFGAMVIDIHTRRSKLGNITGGLSGPAIRPIAVQMVYKTAQEIKIPIIAMGGIMTAEDALEFMIAGASMVAVGTANFINPNAPLEALQGIKQYMKKYKMKDVKELIGSFNYE